MQTNIEYWDWLEVGHQRINLSIKQILSKSFISIFEKYWVDKFIEGPKNVSMDNKY
jgi:hypothetical protein